MKKMINNKRGITLIALVITIIVLLILAGISISMLTGENGLLTKAAESKTKTKIGEIKEAVDLIRGEYLVNNNGKQPTSRYIIEKLIEQDKIDSSQVSDYGDDTGTGIIVVEGENVSIVGGTDQSSEIYLADNSNVKMVINNEESPYLYILKESGNLYEYNIDSNTLYGIVDANQIRMIDSNVKETGGQYNLKNDNSLYSADGTKIAENVKEKTYSFDRQEGGMYVTTNNELYSFQIEGNSYVCNKILDGVKLFYGNYVINNSNELYWVDDSFNVEKVSDNIIEVNYRYYLTSDNKMYGVYDDQLKATDVKVMGGDYYLTNSNTLKNVWNDTISITNVKSFQEYNYAGEGYCVYKTNDNTESYIKSNNSAVQMPQYEKFEEGYYMKNNKLFILNSESEIPIQDNVVSFGVINASSENYWCQFSDNSVYYDIVHRRY